MISPRNLKNMLVKIIKCKDSDKEYNWQRTNKLQWYSHLVGKKIEVFSSLSDCDYYTTNENGKLRSVLKEDCELDSTPKI